MANHDPFFSRRLLDLDYIYLSYCVYETIKMTHQLYNTLPTLSEASEAFTNRGELLPRLAQLFAAPEYRKYAFGLVHHHYDLLLGEWMVTTDRISAPELISSPPDPSIVVDRWTAQSEPFEYARVSPGDQALPPPPEGLLKSFEEIVGKENKYLGMFTAPNLGLGKMYCEAIVDDAKRKQVLNVVDMAGGKEPCLSIDAAWVSDGGIVAVAQVCVNCRRADHM